MKPIAFYLPQYHVVKENNEWWGEGFTEWDTVKRAKKYHHSQFQPKVPLDNYYYLLDDPDAEALIWQAHLAKKYGVYGFCFYHYWFKNNKKMLYKPLEILKKHEEIDINYCVCWANEPWRRTWYAGNSEILIEQEYGEEEDWVKHYNYLRQFFLDKRYICVNNKPLVIIYRTAAIDCLEQMCDLWNNLAQKDGFDGIFLISERTSFDVDKRTNCFSSYCDFEPAFSLHYRLSKTQQVLRILKRFSVRFLNIFLKNKKIENVININVLTKKMGTDSHCNGLPVFPGVCPSWDNTPRKGFRGMYLKNATPQHFYNTISRIQKNNKNADSFIFINAWNEWSEGAFLEPDSILKFGYLEAIKKAVDDFEEVNHHD